jgi:hypothetical protein
MPPTTGLAPLPTMNCRPMPTWAAIPVRCLPQSIQFASMRSMANLAILVHH